jgi:hypothetical protein
MVFTPLSTEKCFAHSHCSVAVATCQINQPALSILAPATSGQRASNWGKTSMRYDRPQRTQFAWSMQPGASMYSFDLTAEQKMLVDTVHRFAEQKLRAAFRQAEESKQIPAPLVQGGWELGLLPGSLDAQYGGFGDYSALTSALYLEELGWGDVGISLHLLTPNLVALPFCSWVPKSRRGPICRGFVRTPFPRPPPR